jgi:hypothetical protein
MSEPRNGAGSIAARLGFLWCGLIHNAPMWPIHGSYLCRVCFRSYHIPWDAKAPRLTQQK